MKALNKKLWRDFWRLRAQAFAITLVISSGIAIFIMSLSTHHSLTITQSKYYQESHFADLFVHCKRAPMHVLDRIKQIPGIKQASPRVTAYVNLQVPNFNEPVLGQILSVPDVGEPTINKPYLRKGRWIQPFKDDEVILSEAFANAHHLSLGDELDAVINGRLETMKVVGIALSAEHIYQIAPGAIFPDYKRYGILWMSLTPLSIAFDLENAFNDLIIQLQPDAIEDEVMRQIDLLLRPYGGQITYTKDDQFSHRFLKEELKQLKTMSVLFPVIFFSVAAFLLNIVINRLIATQREQIALLKAFGYSNSNIGLHYLLLVSLIVLGGIILGLVLGIWLGQGLSHLYSEFYRFPYLIYELRAREVLLAVGVSLGVSSVGALLAVQQAVSLQPAVAMRPPSPPTFKKTWLERYFIPKLTTIIKMILRNVFRRPVKASLSIIGIAFACGILMVGSFQESALDYMMSIQFGYNQIQDVTVTLNEPTSIKALSSIRGLEGVLYAEGHRIIPVKLSSKQHSYRTSLQGFPQNMELERPIDNHLNVMRIPEKGIVLTDYLGKILDVKLGDSVIVEALDGHQRVLEVPVVGFNKQYLGLSAYAQRDYVNQIMREGPAINSINLRIDKNRQSELYPKLQEMPAVVGIATKENMIKSFYETMGETILIFTFIVSILGGILSFGIIYNNARISLAERIRELSTLRVLGFYKKEIAMLLLGELWSLTLIAIPVGFGVGYYLCLFLSSNLQSDLYRVPLIIPKTSLVNAAAIVTIATAITSAILIRNVYKLDMISALKARE